jgi:ABC-type transporter Mla subunit MlaD
MIARRVSALALLIAVGVLVALLLDSGSNPYVIKMQLPDADGLRENSPVAIGGQDVGTISMKVVGGHVAVDMNIDPAHGPVGRDATASVASVNLLGQKRIELYTGHVRNPAPSGYQLPSSQVTVTTDLDQVLDVLTPDVRARLAILINEAGGAFTGRKADFSQVLAQLPPDLHAGTELLNGISSDNHTLANLIQTSDGFISQLAAQRTHLIHLVNVVGQASVTVAAKRAQLAATLAQAPGTLATLQTFLIRLKNTTAPLGPAARAITAAAPVASSTLAQLDPFRIAADPTLQEATRVAPELTRLATGGTPVVAQATPVVGSLATFSQALQPISGIVNHSADNLVAILQNWSRAIQFRDGLSHVFRGEYGFTPQIVTSMINQLQAAGFVPSLHRAAVGIAKLQRSAGSGSATAGNATTPGAGAGSSPNTGSTGGSGQSAGAGGAASNSTAANSPQPTGSGSGSGTGLLGSLLSYLLKP